MRVKICGITRPEQGMAIADLGATALGFILAPSSPRYVTPESIASIVTAISRPIHYIGVFVNEDPGEIRKTVTRAGLTGVQLHGEESPDFCARLRDLLPGIEILKALRVKDGETLERARGYFDRVDTLLFDAYHPSLHGGTGKTLDWESIARFSPPIPWFLAGGLTPDNLTDALTRLSPNGIDLSSGVERSPGDKDLEKVALLFDRLRQIRKSSVS
ncbi:phosphoribosylanthranilate isomerase [Pannus brasiliensis CCIBt3594]|uniref:N-(5'-phosphoribosyl)anthranilate isomerase n=1 Tax=Pannus brasiliensis CCIBt3594 TaxID=1427578 RepID=A0AAW9QSZ4_9CHRO